MGSPQAVSPPSDIPMSPQKAEMLEVPSLFGPALYQKLDAAPEGCTVRVPFQEVTSTIKCDSDTGCCH